MHTIEDLCGTTLFYKISFDLPIITPNSEDHGFFIVQVNPDDVFLGEGDLDLWCFWITFIRLCAGVGIKLFISLGF